MIVILEGCDCVGKTTVANMLSKILKYEVIKGSSFETAKCSPEELYEKYRENALKDNIILDRYFLSNMIYAEKYNDYARLNIHHVSVLAEAMNKVGAIMFVLQASPETLKSRFDLRGDEYVDKKDIDDIAYSYSKHNIDRILDAQELIKTVYLNVDDKTPTELTSMIFSEIFEYTTRHIKIANMAPIFEKQKCFEKYMTGNNYPIDDPVMMERHLSSAVWEIGEITKCDERWKNWKKNHRPVLRQDKLEEFADVMIFLMNALMYSGFTMQDLCLSINDKIDKNFSRQFSDY